MEKILLINPAKPPSKRKKPAKRVKPKANQRNSKMAAKKRRTAAQKRATRKLVAFNKSKGRAPARRKAPTRRRRAPVARKATPARRRRSPSMARRRAPIRRSNPISRPRGMQAIFSKLVMPAITAASGALALDAVWSYIPLPVAIKNGPMKFVVKGLGAVLLGYGANMVVNKRTADELAMGALTVVMHQAAREFMAVSMPNVRMDGMGYMSPALPAGQYGGGMGYYPQQDNSGMGYYPTDGNRVAAPVESESNHNYS